FYAVLANGNFVKVDKATGEFSVVAATDLRPYYNTSATFDDKSGNVIFTYAPAAGFSSMWSIDAATGVASLVLDFADNDQITALSVVKAAAEPLAPAAPQLDADAPDGGTMVSYTITMPTTLFDGSDASGSLKWTLTVDGDEAGSGNSVFGGVVQGSCDVATEGMHTLVAYVENEIGRSPSTKTTVVCGAGVPATPTGLGINNFGDGEISLYWNPVKDSADGAYVDPKAIVYNVIRNGSLVAEGIDDTFFFENIDIPDTYVKLNYEVKAVYAGNESLPAAVSTGIGAIAPPYACSFGLTPHDADLYTVINNNGDNVEWYYTDYYGCFKYDYCDNAADDWLITPAFRLEAGKIYEFSYSIAPGHTMYTERYSLAMGVAPTVAAMVTELVPPTQLQGDLSTPEIKTVSITPATTGNYYLGWHALSDPAQFMIQVKGVKMSAAMVSTSPAAVTDINLDRDATGYLSLHGSFKAPATDISGNALASLGRLTVCRQGKEEPVAEFTSPVPGDEMEFDDNDIPEMGTYTYVITAWDADGNIGREVQASAYVGPIAPEDVPAVQLVEGEIPGTAVLSWDAPVYDVDGKKLVPDNITYMVYTLGDYNRAYPVLDEPVAERKLTLKVCEPDQKDFATFYVSALNLGLEGEGLTRSPMVPVGMADQLPYTDSFGKPDRDDKLLGYIVPAGSYGYVELGNRESAGVSAQDGDDAFICLGTYTPDMSIEFFTGKIDLAGAESPAVSFYYYKWSDSDTNVTDVLAVDRDGNEIPLGYADNSLSGNVGWNLLVCPLDEVKGKQVKIVVRGTFSSHDKMLYDNLRVADRLPVDMAAISVLAPARVEVDRPYVVIADIANLGRSEAIDYTVDLMLNGETVATAQGPALAAGAQTAVEFKQTLSPLTQGRLQYAARVTIDGDGDADNDISTFVSPELIVSRFPAVADLAASRAQQGVHLTWSAPVTTGYDIKDVEDFEDATPWTEEVEGWTMVDRDGKQIGALEGAAMPDAVAMRTTHSFYVFDNESEDILFYNPELAYLTKGNSGSKSLVAMYILTTEADQDDWAISPLLSGEAQTLSFYARRFHPEYIDHMEVLYSTKDSTDPDDFVTLCPDGAFEVPQLVDAIGNAAYKQYEFDLPEGALRFALRAHNMGGEGFMLMVDDVRFKQSNSTLEIGHYDIYRDGTRINTEPVTAPEFTDTEADGAAHSYNVIVKYNRGLSPASNTVKVEALGINDAISGGIRVVADNREIVITGTAAATDVRLYTADGRQAYAGSGDCRIPVAPGTYMLAIGDISTKVVVR
ncbi:MAG: choice-of-anchor J domain-containing protein, partial [Muribaculaceae bacterium]|nr:choice-of-anchor J domain-containing protein [Muribaculaceae bacterium]